MSQSHASARRFPDAPPLSPDNPGTLTPAQLGLLPGALPGRGGPDVVQPFGAGRGSLVRGTLPVSAAGAAVASLVNGLPFGGGQPGRALAEAAQPAPVGAAPVAGGAVAPPAYVAPPASVAELVGAAGSGSAEPPKVIRATVDLSSAAQEAGLVPVPPPLVPTPPPGALVASAGGEPGGAGPEVPAPTPAMGVAGLPLDAPASPAVVSPPAVVAPPQHLGVEPVPPPRLGGPVAVADPGHEVGAAADAAALDSPWLKAPPPAPVPAPLPEAPAVVVATPIQHGPTGSRTWIVALVAVLILVAGAVAILVTRGARPTDDAPLKMDAPTSSPRLKATDEPEPVAEADASGEPAKPIGTGLPPVGPGPNVPPGGYPQGPRPKPTSTASSPAGGAKPPPTATAPKFDPSTI